MRTDRGGGGGYFILFYFAGRGRKRESRGKGREQEQGEEGGRGAKGEGRIDDDTALATGSRGDKRQFGACKLNMLTVGHVNMSHYYGGPTVPTGLF